MQDLEEVNERLSLLINDIKSVDVDVKKFEQESIRTSSRHKEDGYFEILVEQTRAIPMSIRAKAGTVVNEMRSCLDELACRLALRNGAQSEDDTYFPISRSKEIFQKDGIKKIKRLSDVDRNKIVQLEPYLHGHRSLFALHDLDIKRKHRRLMACTAQNSRVEFGNMPPGLQLIGGTANVRITDCVIGGQFVQELQSNVVSIRQLQKPTVVITARGVEAPFRPVVNVTYREPESVAGSPVVDTLVRFHQDVTQIVSMFG